KELELPVMIHTPHRDKKRGTTRSMDVCEEHGMDPGMVVVDHNNEETVRETLDRGFWAAFSIYPSTKMGNARMVEIMKQYGCERVIVDSACDWGISDPLGVAKTAKLALQQGIPEDQVRLATYANALQAYGQSGQMSEDHWLNPPPVDQRTVYEGNSILRGGREPVVEDARARRAEELLIE
ncbi:MAG: hypothetical protein R3349_07710, partial [Geminicoccaceae bacterium]|nr:hypothetical protein [Geminicoccaceae bacterium]